MTFLTTLSVWQWGLALAVPLGIVVLYFLRLKRKRLEVPSTMLWRKSIEDVHVNAFWQRLRRNILLLLQLIVVAGLLAALLRPATHVTQVGRRTILLIDHSGSMSTRDGSTVRLDEAKTKARSILDQLGSGDQAMVIAFSRSPRMLLTWTHDRAALERAIASIVSTALPTRLSETIAMLEGVVSEKSGDDESASARKSAKVYLISDGRFSDSGDLPDTDLDIEYLRVGNQGENVGIISVGVTSSDPSREKWEIYARVRNFGLETSRRSVELFLDDRRIDLRGVDLAGGEEEGVIFPWPTVGGERLEVRLSPGDAFSKDDRAFLVIGRSDPVRILRIGESNPILDAVLDTSTIADIAEVESISASEMDRELSNRSYDLIIFDRCAPKTMPDANTWFIGSCPQDFKHSLESVSSPAILDWDASHPILRFVELDDVDLFESNAVPRDSDVQTLIETDRGAVLFSRTRGVHTDLMFGGTFVDANGTWQTNWPLKPSFPLFVMNVVRVLGGVQRELGNSTRTGAPVTIRTTSEPEQAMLVNPDGERTEFEPVAPGRFEVPAPSQVGIYTLKADGESRSFAVNLFDDVESSIEPVDSVMIGTRAAANQSERFQVRQEWWKWLVLAALAVLLLEWYVYNRRVYV